MIDGDIYNEGDLGSENYSAFWGLFYGSVLFSLLFKLLLLSVSI